MDKLIRDAQQLFNINLSARQAAALSVYERELTDWNQRFNLTAIRDEEGIRTKHFLDSFSCTLAWKDSPPARLVDVGTGAGFPGLPLKLLYPSMRLTLVESVGKKVKFCEHIVNVLGLEGVEVIQARAEDLGHNRAHRERYDWAVARAVAGMPILAEYLLPLVRVGGAMLAQKGESGPAEVQAAERAFRLLGGQVRRVMQVNLPGVADDRYLIVVDKTAATPPQYPRKPGVPAKQPL
ncbi:MAG: 16S rRNA (guanine(527)-N(7))-methyltransferase RsmG [Anaerolineales bacterium]